jgi:hypothetical protein
MTERIFHHALLCPHERCRWRRSGETIVALVRSFFFFFRSLFGARTYFCFAVQYELLWLRLHSATVFFLAVVARLIRFVLSNPCVYIILWMLYVFFFLFLFFPLCSPRVSLAIFLWSFLDPPRHIVPPFFQIQTITTAIPAIGHDDVESHARTGHR